MTRWTHFRTPLLLLIFGLLLQACGGGGLSVGDKAPEFSLPAADGNEVSLSQYKGVKPVLLYFHMALG